MPRRDRNEATRNSVLDTTAKMAGRAAGTIVRGAAETGQWLADRASTTGEAVGLPGAVYRVAELASEATEAAGLGPTSGRHDGVRPSTRPAGSASTGRGIKGPGRRARASMTAGAGKRRAKVRGKASAGGFRAATSASKASRGRVKKQASKGRGRTKKRGRSR